MRLVTVQQDTVTVYRAERIERFAQVSHEYFEECCERLGQGVSVRWEYPEGYFDGLEWD